MRQGGTWPSIRGRKRLASRRSRCHHVGMPFPNHEGKHAGRPYVTARQLLDYHESRGNAQPAVPRAVVVTWSARLENRVRERRDHQELHCVGVGSVLLQLTPDLGLARLPIGAPAAAIAVEELSARGMELLIGVGAVGGLDGRLAAGNLVVCSAALRDEGTSHHYAPPEPFAFPDPGLTARLREALPAAIYGPSWTTDAPYRETSEEIAKYRAEGILTVEMEASLRLPRRHPRPMDPLRSRRSLPVLIATKTRRFAGLVLMTDGNYQRETPISSGNDMMVETDQGLSVSEPVDSGLAIQ
jgi:uridine phosphorylase